MPLIPRLVSINKIGVSMSNANQHHYISPDKNHLGKSHFLMAVGTVAIISTSVIAWVIVNRTAMFRSVDITKTTEYLAVVNEHVDLSQVNKQELDQTATLDNLSERFGVYRFNHGKLRGKWGDLYVLVDRQTSKTTSRSLLPVNGKSPRITVQGNCFQIPQVKGSLIEGYEACIR
jgi:hypothetical protein